MSSTFVLPPQPQSVLRQKARFSVKCQLHGTSETHALDCAVAPLNIGDLVISPPVVLAPMAGVTNYPFRKLCRSYGAALYVSEMVLASSVVAGRENGRVRFGSDEKIRSAQLYGTDPSTIGAAIETLIERNGVRHVDLNFGCPAPKVLRRGGGAAIPENSELLKKIATAAVEAARGHEVPVTAKMRAGLSDSKFTYLTAGQVLQDCGIAAVTLHARTAKQMYDTGGGRAGWSRIRKLRELLEIPVVGNGDVFTAQDALDLLRETDAAGVAIGRGCLGRPWLFRDLREAFRTGCADRISVPGFEEVRFTMMTHVREAIEWMSVDNVQETPALKSMRKWFGWYWRGYVGLPEDWTARMCQAETFQQLHEVLDSFDGSDVGYSLEEVVKERGKVGKNS